jgi:hypothetical protein
MALPDPENPLAIEIQQEAAVAYFEACKKMIDALDALKAFDHAVASAAGIITAGAELLDAAAERVYFVVIQREAMKLSCSEEFFTEYGISNEIRKRMGARRRQSGNSVR